VVGVRAATAAGVAVTLLLLGPALGDRAAQEADPIILDSPRGLDAYVPVPDDNPVTAAKVALGRRLFSDPRLSADGRVSCSSCHRPAHAFSDTVPSSVGV
jgi:cytochrome c peroxidase